MQTRMLYDGFQLSISCIKSMKPKGSYKKNFKGTEFIGIKNLTICFGSLSFRGTNTTHRCTHTYMHISDAFHMLSPKLLPHGILLIT